MTIVLIIGALALGLFVGAVGMIYYIGREMFRNF